MEPREPQEKKRARARTPAVVLAILGLLLGVAAVVWLQLLPTTNNLPEEKQLASKSADSRDSQADQAVAPMTGRSADPAGVTVSPYGYTIGSRSPKEYAQEAERAMDLDAVAAMDSEDRAKWAGTSNWVHSWWGSERRARDFLKCTREAELESSCVTEFAIVVERIGENLGRVVHVSTPKEPGEDHGVTGACASVTECIVTRSFLGRQGTLPEGVDMVAFKSSNRVGKQLPQGEASRALAQERASRIELQLKEISDQLEKVNPSTDEYAQLSLRRDRLQDTLLFVQLMATEE